VAKWVNNFVVQYKHFKKLVTIKQSDYICVVKGEFEGFIAS
jgi:hypothetical protein